MANGANRLFNVMKRTSESTNVVPSQVVSLTVKSIRPLIFIRDDRLEITEEFCTFNKTVNKNSFKIGDIVTAFVFNEGQIYFIQQNNSTSGSGGEGGTTDYNDLDNKPKINGVELIGNKTNEDLNLADLSTVQLLQQKQIEIENTLNSTITTLDNKVSKSGDTMTGDLILDNAHYLKGIDKEGNVIQLIRAYGNKTAIGDGAKETRIWSSTMPTVEINGKVHTLATKEQNILWKDDTGAYMNGSQTAPLSQKVSEQNNGIVLQFRPYTGDTNNKYWYNYIFIPKTHVLYYNGGGVDCFITADNFSAISHKYIYVQDTQLIGHSINVNSGTKNGITFDNTKFVLTAVFGV